MGGKDPWARAQGVDKSGADWCCEAAPEALSEGLRSLDDRWNTPRRKRNNFARKGRRNMVGGALELREAALQLFPLA
jgi:hypothetical protein